MCHIWGTMIWGLFEKSGSLDWAQKHRSAAENNPSSLVSGFYSARSHGTRVKCSYLRTVPCDVAGLFPGFRVSCVGWIFDAPEMRKTTKDEDCSAHFDWAWEKAAGTFAISSTPRLMTFTGFSHVYSSSAPAALENQTVLSQHVTGKELSQKIFFLLRIISRHTARVGVCTHLPNGPPQHGVSFVTPTDLMFPGIFLCVFCLQEVWIRGILVVLVHEWWLLTKGSFRDQRLKT